jgi:hypothetical protein
MTMQLGRCGVWLNPQYDDEYRETRTRPSLRQSQPTSATR